MTDKELLELAAKAADLGNVWQIDENSLVYYVGERWHGGPIKYTLWNPLIDDGDALRLAMKLSMTIFPGEAVPWVEESQSWPSKLACAVGEDEEPDVFAATRRAIVRAAAEIGKEMK
jgi:hypothetical protein